jgi:hypothetical protein
VVEGLLVGYRLLVGLERVLVIGFVHLKDFRVVLEGFVLLEGVGRVQKRPVLALLDLRVLLPGVHLLAVLDVGPQAERSLGRVVRRRGWASLPLVELHIYALLKEI